MLVVSIDGACRRNGKPDCVAAGGTFIMRYHDDKLVDTKVLTNYEINSTNQRGELLALLTALDYIWESKETAHIITDSEYLFNTMTKEWCKNWQRKGWTTASGDPVKNKDILLEILNAQRRCEAEGIELLFYHVKGHAMPFGKVTAQNLLEKDNTGMALYDAVLSKYNTVFINPTILGELDELSTKNNGFALTSNHEILTRFVVTNVVADAIATKCVEAADALM